MSIIFQIVSGGRTGSRYTPASDEFVAGRHADAELRFDPDRDLNVSGRHARFRRREGVWIVQDLESRNGTFVNGRPITGETALQQGDRVRFGAGGPEVELGAAADAPGTTTLRIRAAIRNERVRARIIGAALLSVIVLLGSALALVNTRTRTSRTSDTVERALLERQIDSLIEEGRRTEVALAGEVAGLNAALQESEQRLRRLRTELGASPRLRVGDSEELRRDLLAATSALRRQQLAASLDFTLIQRRARGAVAMVWVEYTDGERATGTAVAVRPDGVLLTNRHLVSGVDGGLRATRIAVRFADSDQAFPARLLAVSRRWDLAALGVDNVLGDVPVVPGLNARTDTVPPGAPVVLIGYPLGGEPERDPALVRRVARPVVSAALLLRAAADVVEVQGLGVEGASGSPILDGEGEVIAILFGGRREGGVQVLLGVPAAAASAFLQTLR